MQRPVASRDEALQHLLRVADYFRKAEPHSPVSYALEQAVRWGRMPLPDLLKDLVSDESVLQEVFKRMGITRPDDSSE
jgi:type VI secretion system protein ImpA